MDKRLKLEDMKDVEAELAKYVPQVRELLGKDLTLARMQPLLACLGNPERKLKIIHIAGTSGKTSTAYYMAALLRAAGLQVGMTVSPHLDSVTERVQINLEPLPDNVFCQALGDFIDLIAEVEPRPTYFELLIAFVYWYFAKVGVDYAVIETGLGGTFDATNVAGNSDKICVITDIGLDHMRVLGNTLTEIAGQKAGIIHANNHVFMHQQSLALMQVFEQKAKEENAMLNVLSINQTISREVPVSAFAALPKYQQRNWSLAKNTYDYLAIRDSLPELSEQQLTQSMAVAVPGRMEIQDIGGKTVIMDGAHNEQKMQAFVSSFQALYPTKKADVLLALKEGKEYKSVLPLLLPITNRLVITSFKTAQDLPIVAINPQVLADAATGLGFTNVEIESDYEKAFQVLLGTPGEIAIITGSFYLLSSLRPAISGHASRS